MRAHRKCIILLSSWVIAIFIIACTARALRTAALTIYMRHSRGTAKLRGGRKKILDNC